MSPVLVFDIETIPDVAGLRRLDEQTAALGDDEVAELAFTRRRASHGNDFLPLHLQRVIVISGVLASRDEFRIFSLAEPVFGEREIIQRFFSGIERYQPLLVSWNGGGFDLPVLHYRGLIHGVVAARYWDMGEAGFPESRDFKWNNYINRYHQRHLDLMDLLAMYQPRANAPLDDLAKLIGFPGKLGMDGSKVWTAWQEGRIAEIQNYCETDVVNTYLVYCRFRRMRGEIDAAACHAEEARVRSVIGELGAGHWREYLAAWPE